MTKREPNTFEFLAKYDPLLAELGSLAEGYQAHDPHACLIRLRQFGDLLARLLGHKFMIFLEDETSYFELLETLKQKGEINSKTYSDFNKLRVDGNNALHHFQGNSSLAKNNLKTAKQLGRWFEDSFIKKTSIPPDINFNRDNKAESNDPVKPANNETTHDFSCDNLSGKDFSRKNLSGYDFTGASLFQTKFCNCILTDARFHGADLRSTNFKGAKNLQSKQLEGALWDKTTVFPENLQRLIDSHGFWLDKAK